MGRAWAPRLLSWRHGLHLCRVDLPDHSRLRLGMQLRGDIAAELVVGLTDDLHGHRCAANVMAPEICHQRRYRLFRDVVIHSDEGRFLLAELAIVHRSWIQVTIRRASRRSNWRGGGFVQSTGSAGSQSPSRYSPCRLIVAALHISFSCFFSKSVTIPSASIMGRPHSKGVSPANKKTCARPWLPPMHMRSSTAQWLQDPPSPPKWDLCLQW